METVIDSHGIKYQRLDNDTCYHAETDREVINVLEWARGTRTRIHIHYGDIATGKDWNEEHDIEGYIGRSTGSIKIPLLVYNDRSYGGGGLLDHCIVKISEARGGYVLYRHPKHKDPEVTITESDLPEYSHSVYLDGELYARCNSLKEAQRIGAWMRK